MSLLEGFNGIGKSSAIRLLLACTGTVPYSGQDRAWLSLKQHVGPTEVMVSDLLGADQISWRFDTRTWIDRQAPISTEWFESITIDGRRSTLDDVRKLLVVYRLSGDTGVVDTLAEEIEAFREIVERFRQDAESTGANPGSAAAALALVSRTLAVAGSVDAATITHDQRELDLARAELERQRERQRVALRVAEDAKRAVETASELKQLIDVGPELDIRIEAIRASLKSAQDRRSEVNEELEKIAVAASIGAEQLKELDAAERLLSKNLERLSDAVLTLADDAATLGVVAEVQPIQESIAHAEAELERLAVMRAKADIGPTLVRTIDAMERPLSDAINQELGSEFVLPAGFTSQRTVENLSAALADYRTELERAPRSETGAEAQARFNIVALRLDGLRKLPGLIDSVERFSRLSEQHSKTVTDLAKSSNLGAAGVLDKLHEERDSLDLIVLELFSERARLIKQRGLLGGGSDVTVLEARLAAQLEDLQLSSAEALDEAWADANQKEFETSARLAEAEAAVRAAETSFQAHQEELLSAASLIASDGEFLWLRNGLPDIVPTDRRDPETALARVTEISSRAKHAQSRLRGLPIQLLAIEQALNSLAGELRGKSESATQFVPALRAWLESRFATYFAQDAIRPLLLSDEATDVRVDIAAGSVRWSEGQVAQEKPLEAFSSGQQAFAYARARLGLLDQGDGQAQNRLICLDEFGAFMSADRRSDLDEFLTERASEHPADRTLLVLPVRIDYVEAANGALGDEREMFLEKARLLDKYGLLIEDLA